MYRVYAEKKILSNLLSYPKESLNKWKVKTCVLLDWKAESHESILPTLIQKSNLIMLQILRILIGFKQGRKTKQAKYNNHTGKYTRKYKKIWKKKHNEVILALQILTYIINLT